MFLDLDDFKIVNDTLGHAAGDQLLVAVAERIAELLRPATWPRDSVATSSRSCSATHDRRRRDRHGRPDHRRAASCRSAIAGKDVDVGAASGSPAPTRNEPADDLLRNADVAMYTAKSNGKRRIASSTR